MFGLLIVSIYGWAVGDPGQLLIGWDSDRNGCGHSEATKDYPYLYWPQMPKDELIEKIETSQEVDKTALLANGVCVKECPSAESKIQCHMTKTMKDDQAFNDCIYYMNGQFRNNSDVDQPFRYSTYNFLDHFCLPKTDFAGNIKV